MLALGGTLDIGQVDLERPVDVPHGPELRDADNASVTSDPLLLQQRGSPTGSANAEEGDDRQRRGDNDAEQGNRGVEWSFRVPHRSRVRTTPNVCDREPPHVIVDPVHNGKAKGIRQHTTELDAGLDLVPSRPRENIAVDEDPPNPPLAQHGIEARRIVEAGNHSDVRLERADRHRQQAELGMLVHRLDDGCLVIPEHEHGLAEDTAGPQGAQQPHDERAREQHEEQHEDCARRRHGRTDDELGRKLCDGDRRERASGAVESRYSDPIRDARPCDAQRERNDPERNTCT